MVASSGDAFEVALEGDPTAGYVWQVDAAGLAGVAELVGRETRPPAPPAVGGQAVQVFRFRAVAPGSGDLVFRYGRSWEAAPVREHRVRVTVSSAEVGPPRSGSA